MSFRPYKSYAGDPYWTTAKCDCVDSKGRIVKKGDRILYFPKGKQVFTGEEADTEWRSFESNAADESFMTGEY